MKLLVIGNGAREHAIIWKIRQNHQNMEIYCASGNAGISQMAKCIDISPTDIEGLVSFAKDTHIDFTIVGPEQPLSLGIVDLFEENGLKIFGPDKKAAIIEYSKSFSKDFMKRNNIPTASYETFEDYKNACQYVENYAGDYPLVVKSDGLASGKGVIICGNKAETLDALKELMVNEKFKDSGKTVVIEEFLDGFEISVLSFCDGKTIIPMVESQDHKKALDNDEGLNTGGMGSYSPCKDYTDEMKAYSMENIFKPTLEGMEKEGRKFKGILFFGLMVTKKGIKVIEYNARFGDPETQVVLPRLNSDLLEIFIRCENETLDQYDIKWNNNAAVCVVCASSGYPEEFETGFPITGLELFENSEDIYIFHGGTKFKHDDILTAGGRVLSVCGVGEDIAIARDVVYDNISSISYKNKFFRQDIAIKGL